MLRRAEAFDGPVRHNGLQRTADGHEIDDALVLIQRTVYLGSHAGMCVLQPLALAVFQRDEVSGGEDQIVVGDADVEGRHERN